MTHTLERGVVHVIRASLDRPPIDPEQLEPVLSPAERAQAARFAFREDRWRHVLGRGLLRHFLARQLGADPPSLQFETTAAGKPALAGGPAFNISHSGDVVLVAVAGEGRLGVDVEAIRPIEELEQLARRTFVPDELEQLRRLPAEARLRPFFRLWSRKEAVLKALGLGIGALDSISVSSDPETENALRRLDRAGEDVRSWTVRPLACGQDVEAAIAWDREIREIVMTDAL